MYLGNGAAIGWKHEAAPRPKMSTRLRRARDSAGGPCRSELKAIRLAGLVTGPLCTFLGVEGG